MADLENGILGLIDEGARASSRPPLADLQRRVRHRRTRRTSTVAVIVLAASAAVIPLAGSERSGNGALRPTATVSSSPRTADNPPPQPPTASPRTTTPGAHPSSLTASPSTTSPGGTVTLFGEGCAPVQAVSLGIGSTAGTGQLASTDTDATGAFEGTVVIPASTGTGSVIVWAQCQTKSSTDPLNQYVSISIQHR
jgi:hypothetical protein